MSYNWYTHKSHQGIGKGAGRLENKGTVVVHPDYRVIKTGQNTESGPGYMRRLSVVQTPVKNHQLKLV